MLIVAEPMNKSRDYEVPAQNGHDAVPSADAVVRLLHDRILGRRLYVHAVLRFALTGVLLSGAMFARYVGGITDLRIGLCTGLVVTMVVWNTWIFIVASPYRDTQRPTPPHRRLTGLMHATICLDLVFLTFLLWIAGGAKSPIKVFYLIHVFLAALLLGPHAAYGHALFGFALLSGLVLGQWWGWIPHLMPVGVVNSAEPINGHYVFTVLVVQGTAMGVAAYLVSGLTKMLHDGESQLSQANAELSKLSQLRRAFLHTALHDLKAPFDAIAMILYNLEAGSPDRMTEQQAKWVARCRLRLNEVSAFLRDFQTIASLDGATLEREGTPINVAAMLHQLVRENEDLAEERMHEVLLDAPGTLPAVIGIERLLHEAAANLITNAIKYTPLGGKIHIRAFCRNTFMRIEVADNGVGIASEDRARLFQEFARFHRRQERTGKMPGSGLGLSIVRRIVELHGGTVGLQSSSHEGSTFFIELPLTGDGSTCGYPVTPEEHPLSASADAR